MSTMAIGRTALLVLVAALLVAPAACQEPHSHDDEFSLLGIPRPAGMPFGFGMPMLNVGKLMDSIVGDMEDRTTAQPAEQTHMRVFRMPPVLSSLLRGTAQPPQPVQEKPQVMRMRFMMPMQFHLSQPLQELRNLASACVPCADANRVQAHMRSISVMNGPNGERVETVTETGPDGEEHTTRKVTKAQAQSGSVQDFMDAVIAPLMGGMPDIERIMKDVQSVDSEDVDAPQDAPKKVSKDVRIGVGPGMIGKVSKEDAKAAVESSLLAKGLNLGSADKRQKLAVTIADKLGISPGSVQVSVDKSDEEEEEEEEKAVADEGVEDQEDMEGMEDEDEDADAPPVDAPPVDDESDLDEDEAADVTADQDVDELGKEFDQEEEDKEAVVKREEETLGKVSKAADEAQDKADHLKALEEKMKQSNSLVV